ncbi:MAG: conserved rane protein of unknown function [Acidimicrobiaceae bacterium]|nr:conserved rane protein of unknown function [Acidimicrobiaceae bacterium]
MMSRSDVVDTWPALSAHHRKVRLRGDRAEIGLLVLRLVAVGLLISIGWLHVDLWRSGYRYLPTIGPLFLVAATVAMAAALGMLVRPSRLIGLLGIGLVSGILVGLIISVSVGLFGFYETLSAPFAVESVVLEFAAALTLASWVALDAMKDSRQSERAAGTRVIIRASTKQRTIPSTPSPPLHRPARNRHRCAAHR